MRQGNYCNQATVVILTYTIGILCNIKKPQKQGIKLSNRADCLHLLLLNSKSKAA